MFGRLIDRSFGQLASIPVTEILRSDQQFMLFLRIVGAEFQVARNKVAIEVGQVIGDIRKGPIWAVFLVPAIGDVQFLEEGI